MTFFRDNLKNSTSWVGGNGLCPRCGKPYIYVGDIVEGTNPQNYMCSCNDKKFETNFNLMPQIGWICPRCGRSNAPFVKECICTPIQEC